jgi:hypothetical protein
VPNAHAVAGFDCAGERHDDRGGGIEIVGVLLDADQRSNTRQEFVHINGLGQKIVCSRFHPDDAVRAGIERRDDDHRRQPCCRVVFEATTDLEAVDTRHVDVE